MSPIDHEDMEAEIAVSHHVVTAVFDMSVSPFRQTLIEAVRGTQKGARLLHEARVEDGVRNIGSLVQYLCHILYNVIESTFQPGDCGGCQSSVDLFLRGSALAQTALTLSSVVFQALASFPTAMFLCASHGPHVEVCVCVIIFVWICICICIHMYIHIMYMQNQKQNEQTINIVAYRQGPPVYIQI